MLYKPIIKIICLLIIIGLNWAGLSAVLETFAYFSDTETSINNVFQAGTLDFSIPATPDFSPSVTPTATSSRSISLINEGTLGFQYIVQTSNATDTLCDYLNLTANLNGNPVYNSTLTSFTYNAGEFSTSTDDWEFTVTLTSSEPNLQNKSCQFKFVFEGWQVGFSDSSSGFSDREEIINNVTTGDWLPRVTVIYPNGGEIWYLVPDGCPNKPWCSAWCQAQGMNANCQYPIKWTATNQIGPDIDLLINIYFSADSGATWMAQIANDTENDGVYWWKPPFNMSYVTGQARIKVKATHKDYPFLTDWDMSDDNFCPPLLTFEELLNWEEPPVEEEPITEEESAPEESIEEAVDEVVEEELVNEEPTNEKELPIEENPVSEEEPADEEPVPTEEQAEGETSIIEGTDIEEVPATEENPIGEENLAINEEQVGQEEVATEESVVEEELIIEEPVIEEVPTIEEQPVVVPPENNSGEQAPPADNSSSGGDSGGGDSGGGDSGGGETVSAAPSDGVTE